MVGDGSSFLNGHLPGLTRLDQTRIEASIVSGYGMGKDVFILPCHRFSRMSSDLRRLEADAFHNYLSIRGTGGRLTW